MRWASREGPRCQGPGAAPGTTLPGGKGRTPGAEAAPRHKGPSEASRRARGGTGTGPCRRAGPGGAASREGSRGRGCAGRVGATAPWEQGRGHRCAPGDGPRAAPGGRTQGSRREGAGGVARRGGGREREREGEREGRGAYLGIQIRRSPSRKPRAPRGEREVERRFLRGKIK
jgi:hypothetical protein